MKDVMGLMKQAQAMQAKLGEMQADVERIECEGLSGGGMVRAVLNGKGELKTLTVDPGLLVADEKEILEDLIVTAHEDARKKVEPCTICRDPRRDATTVVVVESVADLWALERAGVVRGRYHVLGGTLSPLDGIGPADLNLDGLVGRVERDAVREIILAVNATVDGQTTAHYVTDLLSHRGDLTVTRLAHGVPVGGELDYLDEGTLAAAVRARTAF